MEPKKGHALRRTVITEDQIRQCREISDEIHSHEVVELVALLSDDVRRKVVLAPMATLIPPSVATSNSPTLATAR